MQSFSLKKSDNEKSVKLTAQLNAQRRDSLNFDRGDDVFSMIKAASCILFQLFWNSGSLVEH